MTREGAVEVNAATGKKKRISKRIRDADFAKTEAPQPPEQAAQTIPGGAAPAPTAAAPPLPHAPGSMGIRRFFMKKQGVYMPGKKSLQEEKN